jgi:SAM-dependent methyltransferase
MQNELNGQYWEQRYQSSETGWDIGYASPPLTNYIDTLTDREMKILIPGCGNGYEAAYLHEKGFKQVFLLDIAPTPLAQFAAKYPEFPGEHLILGDFFEHKTTYDLIIEQTFFCALHPDLRSRYVEKMASLLHPGGRLAGLLFNCRFEKAGPPFGGDINEYRELFDKQFITKSIQPEEHSIPPRAGNEVFAEFIKP